VVGRKPVRTFWRNYMASIRTARVIAAVAGASNQSNTAQLKDSAFTAVNQGNENVAVTFSPLWW
jgi:hypothetical protein